MCHSTFDLLGFGALPCRGRGVSSTCEAENDVTFGEVEVNSIAMVPSGVIMSPWSMSDNK